MESHKLPLPTLEEIEEKKKSLKEIENFVFTDVSLSKCSFFFFF